MNIHTVCFFSFFGCFLVIFLWMEGPGLWKVYKVCYTPAAWFLDGFWGISGDFSGDSFGLSKIVSFFVSWRHTLACTYLLKKLEKPRRHAETSL